MTQTKTFFKVDADFTGQINLAGQPKPYTGGDLIALDSTSQEERNLVDLGVHDLSNNALRDAALASLVDDGDLVACGVLAGVGSSTHVWSLALTLADVASGEVARIKPGFTGRVIGSTFLATADATTSSKAATLGLSIDPSVAPGSDDAVDYADEITLLTQTGTPTGGDSTITITAEGEEVGEFDIAFDDTVPEVQAKVDAVPALDDNIVVGGSTGAWTLAFAGDLANLDITVGVDDNLTGGTAPALTATTPTAGGGVRLVGASGNPATIDLTSAAVTDGGVIAGETIATGTNVKHGNFGPHDEIVISASAVTAFVEGTGIVTVTLLQTA